MSDLIWKIKQWVRKLVPITVVGALLYGGFTLYKRGVFRHGVGPAVTTVLHKIPYFGSRFKHYSAPSAQSQSFAYAPEPSKRKAKRGRKHHGRRHGRRHRR